MVKKAAMFIAEGSEPIEVTTPVDVLRRGGVDVDIISTMGDIAVALNKDVQLIADLQEEAFDPGAYDLIVVPGGDPGYKNLAKSEILAHALKQFIAGGRFVASICAGPSILAEQGLLEGRKATCYPGFEATFPEGTYANMLGVVKDDNLITASGPAFAMQFGVACLEALEGEAVAKRVAAGLLMNVQ